MENPSAEQESAAPKEANNTLLVGLRMSDLVKAGAAFSFFGTLGFLLGSLIGKMGENVNKISIGKTVFQWGLGVFSGLVASYSTLKMAERESLGKQVPATPGPELVPTEPPTAPVIVSPPKPEEKLPLAEEQARKLPQAKIEAPSVEHAGELASAPQMEESLSQK